jgi:hypothetical protein
VALAWVAALQIAGNVALDAWPMHMLVHGCQGLLNAGVRKQVAVEHAYEIPSILDWRAQEPLRILAPQLVADERPVRLCPLNANGLGRALDTSGLLDLVW